MLALASRGSIREPLEVKKKSFHHGGNQFHDLRMSYVVEQRKSGTISVVNCGEEKVRVHMNVVLRSTSMNTNGETEN